MPERKKPSRPRKPASRTPSQRARTTRPAPRRTTSRAKPPPPFADQPFLEEEDELEAEDTAGELGADSPRVGAFGSRPIAVGATQAQEAVGQAGVESEPVDVEAEADALDTAVPTEERPPTDVIVERPRVEFAIAGVAALLALSVLFMKWYSVAVNAEATPFSGWASGTWGPVVFFLALAVVVIVVLRRLRIPVAFPFETSTVIEGIGYFCVAALLLKRFFRPETWNVKVTGWFVSIILSAALFLLAGMMSSSAPLVLKPGWFRGAGGKLGVLILVFALLGGAAFGMTNDPPGPKPPKACGQDFPRPPGVPKMNGIENTLPAGPYCAMTGIAPISVNRLVALYNREFTRLKWNHREFKPKKGDLPLAKGQRILLVVDPKICAWVPISGFAGKTGKTSSHITIISGSPKDFGTCQGLPGVGTG